MDVINEIIAESAVGPMSRGVKCLVLSIFSFIVLSLIAMLVGLILQAPYISPSFGY